MANVVCGGCVTGHHGDCRGLMEFSAMTWPTAKGKSMQSFQPPSAQCECPRCHE